MLVHPEFDPVAIHLGPVAVRWYGLMYLVGFLAGLFLGRLRARKRPELGWSTRDIDDLMFYCVIGTILGGRLGYVLFYKLAEYLHDLVKIFYLWEGGMSFHGGFLGVILAMAVFAYRRGRHWFAVTDFLAPLVPIGLAAGRLGNFINGELWGRPTDVPWAMIFPRGGPMPRHPSQLYQATFEGILLFSLLLVVWRFTDGRKRPGLITGVFCMGYAVARIVGEIFREPDSFLGFILGSDWLTMGMLLSLPVLAFGAWLVIRAYRNPLLTGARAPMTNQP